MARKATIRRKTAETNISVGVNLDGAGTSAIDTTIPFLDHMLNLLARHGRIDMTVKSTGDTEIDDHHLAEDLGICLGEATGKALGDKKGINRYGSATLPMDESLCRVAMDISGRPFLVYKVRFGEKTIGNFDPSLLREFFKAFSDHSGITLHIELLYGRNNHHMAEAIFKAFARALREAIRITDRRGDVPSTKGSL